MWVRMKNDPKIPRKTEGGELRLPVVKKWFFADFGEHAEHLQLIMKGKDKKVDSAAAVSMTEDLGISCSMLADRSTAFPPSTPSRLQLPFLF